MSDSIRDDTYINKYELAELWEIHTSHFLDWGERLSDAIKERDDIKSKLDLEKEDAKDELNYIKAQVEIDYRTNYTKYGLKKAPGDKYCEALVISSKKYQDALMDYREVTEKHSRLLAKAEHKINVLKVAKEAFEQRKVSMDNLTRLMIGGFYSAKIPRDLKEEVEKNRDSRMEERARAQSDESMERRRK